MAIWNAVLLGLIHGIAEFLPVSSSGHFAAGVRPGQAPAG